jgi:hypothetical protein
MTIADAAKAIGDFTGIARYTKPTQAHGIFFFVSSKKFRHSPEFRRLANIPATSLRAASD